MPSTGLIGPYSLDNNAIDAVVTREDSAGAYALGRFRGDTEVFVVCYVGRSDNDIKGRLKDWVGSKYPLFKFGYYGSPKAAFDKECNLYHDFGGKEKLDNDVHPQRPDDTNWQCPQCDKFKKKKP